MTHSSSILGILSCGILSEHVDHLSVWVWRGDMRVAQEGTLVSETSVNCSVIRYPAEKYSW